MKTGRMTGLFFCIASSSPIGILRAAVGEGVISLARCAAIYFR